MTDRSNIVDRVIEYLAPVHAARRMQARQTMAVAGGGYRGGAVDRRSIRKWRPNGGSADADTIPDLPDLRARSRDLARNNMIGGGAIATVTTNVVGDGLELHPAIDRRVLGLDEDAATEWEATARREFALFCKSSDFTGVQCFAEQQELAFRSVLESGDVLALRRYRDADPTPYKTRIQIIEADRVSNPHRRADTDSLVDGVQLGGDGRHLGYWVSDKHPGALWQKANRWRYVPARYVDGRPIALHLLDRRRPDQTRGVPYLAPVIEALKQLGDYTDAEVAAAVISAMFTVFIKNTPDPESTPLAPVEKPTSGANEVELGRGAIVPLADGEEPVFASPTRPNAGFDKFTVSFLTQVGVALELPLELLIKHFTASYSASRAALEMAWSFFRKKRNWLASRFCQPAYEMFLDEAVMSGRIKAPGYFDETRPEIRAAYAQAEWIGPARPYLDPLKEAKADQTDIDTGVKTREEVIAERTGGSFDRKHAQLVKEETARKRDGLGQQQRAAPPPPDPADEDPDKE